MNFDVSLDPAAIRMERHNASVYAAAAPAQPNQEPA